jgi:hypothetical protein
MAYKKYCLDCDKLFQPTGKYQKYCVKCQKLRRKEVTMKRKVDNEKIIYKKDMPMLRR